VRRPSFCGRKVDAKGTHMLSLIVGNLALVGFGAERGRAL